MKIFKACPAGSPGGTTIKYYCCGNMEQELISKERIEIILNWDKEFEPEVFLVDDNGLPLKKINYCPFCGEKIEII